MYFGKDDHFDAAGASPVCELLAPAYEVNGKEYIFAAVPGADGRFCDGELYAEYSAEPRGDGLWKITAVFSNCARYKRVLKLIIRARSCFAADKYTVPCVLYDGNCASKGHEPHGLSADGEAWIFSAARTPLPAETVSESEQTVFGMFASPCGEDNQNCACSLIKNTDGSFEHRIYYPVTEAPYSYTSHDVLTPRLDTYAVLEPDSEFRAEFYIYSGTPEWRNYGVAAVMKRALREFAYERKPERSPEQAYSLGLAYCEYTVCDYAGTKMFRNILLPDSGSGFCFPYQIFEAGWSGQNILQARLFCEEYARSGSKKHLDIALSCLDSWEKTQEANGLFPTNYARFVSGSYIPADVCNLGWAAAEMLRAYTVLHTLGIEKSGYLRFGERLCDFFCSAFSETDGFGLSYDIKSGEKTASGGSIGGFAVMALTEGYRTLGKAQYLETAEKAIAFYYTRDIDQFICTAGAIDCACIDKETAYPFIVASLDLYDETGNVRYLECAKKAAYYFLSWMYLYDVVCPEGSDFEKYGYYTGGATSVSTQHPALDSWGSVAVAELLRIFGHTDDMIWLRCARMLWCSSLLCIADENTQEIHGRKRPRGAQSEAYFPARWAREKYYRNVELRGSFNDLFAGWCSAYRMLTVNKLRSLYGDIGCDALR